MTRRIGREAISMLLSIGLLAVLIYRIAPYLQVHDVQPGDRAPGFELLAENGQGLSLSDFKNKWVLVNFWATWCAPCVDEVPSLNRLQTKLQDRGFVVLGVSVDEDPDAYVRFIADYQVAFPTARNPERVIMARYGTSLIPESYLVNPEGIVVRKYINWQDWDSPEIVNYIESLL